MINYTELDPPYTRVHEHKLFTPWEKHDRTVAFREFSRETGTDDVPYYPKRLALDRQLLAEYRLAAEKVAAFPLWDGWAPTAISTWMLLLKKR